MNRRDTKNIEEMQDNIFDIENADSYFCEVYYYTTSHDELLVRIRLPDKSIKLNFLETQFFSGTMDWIGANFRLHPRSDCIKLLEQYKPELLKLYRDSNLPTDILPYLHLYSVKTKNDSLIQIIAASASIVDND